MGKLRDFIKKYVVNVEETNIEDGTQNVNKEQEKKYQLVPYVPTPQPKKATLLQKFMSMLVEFEEIPVNKEKTAELEETLNEGEFVSTFEIEKISKHLEEKIEKAKRDLQIIGDSLNGIDLNAFEGSQDTVNMYLQLVNDFQKMEENYQSAKSNTWECARLEIEFDNFYDQLQEKLQEIKGLFFLSQMKWQNSNLKNMFNTKSGSEISEKELDETINFIKMIGTKFANCGDKYKTDLANELLEAEYRIKMLKLMRAAVVNNPIRENPFSSQSKIKKQKYESILLQDLAEATEQYNGITEAKKKKLKKKKLYESYDFDELDRTAEQLSRKIDEFALDDYSITEIFEDLYVTTLKSFVSMKSRMNAMDRDYREILEQQEYR